MDGSNKVAQSNYGDTYRQTLITLLSQDLDFHNQDNKYASHDFHAFPAKFPPPQLPAKFIQGLTNTGDIVLDPLALLLIQVKNGQYNPDMLTHLVNIS